MRKTFHFAAYLHAAPGMEFRFIDNNVPLDQHSQKLIRSHAMKGKNLGKTILARGHKKRQCEKRTYSDQTRAKPECLPKAQNGRLLLPKATKSAVFPAAASSQQMTLLPNYFCGEEISYFINPEPFTSSSRYLFHECV